MIIDEKTTEKIDNKVKDGKMKKGFWVGLLSFFLAKISHLLITFAIGLWFGLFMQPLGEISWAIIKLIDNPIVGVIYLIFVTRWIYFKLTR
jgi:hypothetical protein